MTRDLADVLRRFRHQPGFVGICVLTLALGIGASTTIFSVLNAVVLRPLPYGDAASLVYVWAPHRMLPGVPVNAIGPSSADFFSLQRDARAFSAMAYFDPEAFSVAIDGGTDRVPGANVSASFFATLGARPILGRAIGTADDEDGRNDVAVISHRLWLRAFAGDPSILGRDITINRHVRRLIGVMAPSFNYPRAEDLLPGEISGDATDIWIPRVLTAEERTSRDFSDNTTIARLADGVSIDAAQQELSGLMANLDRTRTPEMQGWSVALRSLVESSLGDARAQIWLLFGAVSLLLLIACSNAAHLLLSRAAERGREMSIRTALGAGRWRLIRQMLVESTALAVLGGAAGVGLTYAAVQAVTWINPGNVPRLAETSVDARVLIFNLAVSLATGLIFGLVPARWAAGADANDVLMRTQAKQLVSRGRMLRQAMIVGEVALAVVLMAGAGLFLRSYAAIQRVDTGFSPSAVLMNVHLDERYATETARRQFFRTLIDRVRAVPGVQTAGIVDALPLSHTERLNRFDVEGYPNAPEQLVHARSVTPDYFAAIGTRVLEGRAFAETDVRRSAPVMIVNEAFARRYFPGRSAIDGHFRFHGEDEARPPRWSTIVGVVADVRHSTIEELPLPQVYDALWQGGADHGYLVVRSALPAPVIVAATRDAARAIDPALALGRIGSMSDLVSEATARRRFQTSFLTAFGVVALLLSAVGLYGLLAYLVKQRMTEIGIRLALGAQARDIVWLVVGRGMGLTLTGLIAGIAAALTLTRFVRVWLYETPVTDHTAYGGAAIALMVAAALASWLPARRATRADVVSVLRAE